MKLAHIVLMKEHINGEQATRNKLYIQSNFVLSGQTQTGSKKNYIVTQVQVNIN